MRRAMVAVLCLVIGVAAVMAAVMVCRPWLSGAGGSDDPAVTVPGPSEPAPEPPVTDRSDDAAAPSSPRAAPVVGPAGDAGQPTPERPAAAARALQLPSIQALDRLSRAGNPQLRLTEKQQAQVDALKQTIAGRAEELLGDNREAQQRLRREMRRAEDDELRRTLQKELAGLMARQREVRTTLNREFMAALEQVLSAAQVAALGSATEPGRSQAREDGGSSAVAPLE